MASRGVSGGDGRDLSISEMNPPSDGTKNWSRKNGAEEQKIGKKKVIKKTNF